MSNRNLKKFILGVMKTYDPKMDRFDNRLQYQQKVKNERRIDSAISKKSDAINSLYNITCNMLPPHHKAIVNMRCVEGKTLRECGEQVGVTPERIRQIEKRSYELLQEYSHIFIHVIWPELNMLTLDDIEALAEYQDNSVINEHDVKMLEIGEYYGR